MKEDTWNLNPKNSPNNDQSIFGRLKLSATFFSLKINKLDSKQTSCLVFIIVQYFC